MLRAALLPDLPEPLISVNRAFKDFLNVLLSLSTLKPRCVLGLFLRCHIRPEMVIDFDLLFSSSEVRFVLELGRGKIKVRVARYLCLINCGIPVD